MPGRGRPRKEDTCQSAYTSITKDQTTDKIVVCLKRQDHDGDHSAGKVKWQR